MNMHKNACLTPLVESGSYGWLRAGQTPEASREAAGVSFRFRWPIAARMIVQQR